MKFEHKHIQNWRLPTSVEIIKNSYQAWIAEPGCLDSNHLLNDNQFFIPHLFYLYNSSSFPDKVFMRIKLVNTYYVPRIVPCTKH